MDIESLHKYVQAVASKVMKDASKQTVLSGTIVQSLAGTYEVRLIDGESSSLVIARSLYGDVSYKEDDLVYLLKSEIGSGENFTTQYVIFGLVNLTEAAYKVSSAYERFVVEVTGEISSNDAKLDGKGQSTIIESLKAGYPDLFQTIKVTGAINLCANISIDGNPNEFTDYGFKMEVNYSNGLKTDIFKLNVPYFVGQPYKLKESAQHRFVQLDINKKDYIEDIKISLYNEMSGATVSAANIRIESGNVAEMLDKFSVKLVSNNSKNYLNKDSEDLVTLTAIGFFEDQQLSENLLKYFWFIKDDNIEENTLPDEGGFGYNPLMGAGWRCLTTYKYAKEVVEGKIGTSELKLWNSVSNTFEFNTSLCNKYENKIVCVATYQGNAIKSEEFTLYDFNREDVDAELSTDSVNLTLIYPEDTIQLICNTTSKNSLSALTLNYTWYYTDENETKMLDESKESFLSITGTDFLSGNRKYYCKVSTKKDDETIIELATTNTIIISSLVQEYLNRQFAEEVVYKNWISEENNLIFEAETITEEKDGFKYREYKTGIDAEETSFNPFDNQALLNVLGDAEKRFIYSSTQTRIKKSESIVDKRDYTYPTIVRYVERVGDTIVNLYGNTALEQLNTFNQLTQGGSSQGIFFTDAEYALTQDKTPDLEKIKTGKGYYKKQEEVSFEAVDIKEFDPNKTYYIKVNEEYQEVTSDTKFDENQTYYLKNSTISYILLEQNENNYVYTNGEISEFKTDIDYYEQNGNALFINASYIKTGALTVGNDATNPIFQAGWDETQDGKPVVKIAGFDVNEDAIKSEKISLSFEGLKVGGDLNDLDVVLSPSELKVGDGISATKNEDGWVTEIKGNVHIAGSTINEGSIDADKLNVEELSAISANMGQLTAGSIYSSAKSTGKANLLIDEISENFFLQTNENNTITVITDYDIVEPYTEIDSINENISSYNVFRISIGNNTFYRDSVTNFSITFENKGLRKATIKISITINTAAEGELTEFYLGGEEVITLAKAVAYILMQDEPAIYFPKFQVTEDGDAKLEGSITATSGSIGGFHITGNHLASGNPEEDDSHLVMISGKGWKVGATSEDPGDYVFWAGEKSKNGNDSTRPFWIQKKGKIKATEGQIGPYFLSNNGFFIQNEDKNPPTLEGGNFAMFIGSSEQTDAGSFTTGGTIIIKGESPEETPMQSALTAHQIEFNLNSNSYRFSLGFDEANGPLFRNYGEENILQLKYSNGLFDSSFSSPLFIPAIYCKTYIPESSLSVTDTITITRDEHCLRKVLSVSITQISYRDNPKDTSTPIYFHSRISDDGETVTIGCDNKALPNTSGLYIILFGY